MNVRTRFSRVEIFWLLAVCYFGNPTEGAVINVVPGDSYSKIEAARPGDEVVIAPGTYAFRVYLRTPATATNPIVVRAQNPASPPVWDFGGTLVENAPGSYTAGDRGRGGWQFNGASNYKISGVVFRHCRTGSKNSAGIRYYGGTTNLYIKDCVFDENDNGLTGGTQESEATVEFCEFSANGDPTASSPTHNIYIYGGTFAMRYSYLHDSVQSQNFHVRARIAVLEYNWFARAKSYEGDLMSDADFSGAGPYSQMLTLRGNVFVQHASPDNHSQVVALFNDTGVANLALSVRLLYNTFIGNGGSAAFVHLSNADGTQMSAEASNNIIFGTTRPTLVENSAVGPVSGVNNWLQTNATAGTLINSVRSASPGFRNSAANDYTLSPSSVCAGGAQPAVAGLPGKEYYFNEATNRMWRVRAAARDIGAFENATSSVPIGPYDPSPLLRLGIAPSSGTALLSWPLFATGYLLEQSDLKQPNLWNLALYPYTTNATGVAVTANATSAAAFFRLRK